MTAVLVGDRSRNETHGPRLRWRLVIARAWELVRCAGTVYDCYRRSHRRALHGGVHAMSNSGTELMNRLAVIVFRADHTGIGNSVVRCDL